jgi:four helix bundle protein
MQSKTRSYKDLIVWQKAIELAKVIYRITAKFSQNEKFGMIAQLRRAAISVPSNIAEGQARRTTGEFIQFVSNAEGSLTEAETQLILSCELSLCQPQDAQCAFDLVVEIRKMLNVLRRTLVARN